MISFLLQGLQDCEFLSFFLTGFISHINFKFYTLYLFNTLVWFYNFLRILKVINIFLVGLIFAEFFVRVFVGVVLDSFIIFFDDFFLLFLSINSYYWFLWAISRHRNSSLFYEIPGWIVKTTVLILTQNHSSFHSLIVKKAVFARLVVFTQTHTYLLVGGIYIFACVIEKKSNNNNACRRKRYKKITQS